MIPGDLLSAFPHRQFHTLPRLLDSWAALPNSNPNACMPMQGGSLYHFYDGLWYDPAERRTHDLLCERRTRYQLSQSDMVVASWRHHTIRMIRMSALLVVNQGLFLGWVKPHDLKTDTGSCSGVAFSLHGNKRNRWTPCL